jgi:hypothetical protein
MRCTASTSDQAVIFKLDLSRESSVANRAADSDIEEMLHDAGFLSARFSQVDCGRLTVILEIGTDR